LNYMELIGEIDEYEISFEELARLADGTDLTDFINKLSLEIARRFIRGELDYEVADGAMNYVFDFMTDNIFLTSSGNYIPSPALDIYEAFDAGEYRHSKDDDSVCPIEKYTKPFLMEVFKTYGN